jgi:hypothetical protein
MPKLFVLASLQRLDLFIEDFTHIFIKTTYISSHAFPLIATKLMTSGKEQFEVREKEFIFDRRTRLK